MAGANSTISESTGMNDFSGPTSLVAESPAPRSATPTPVDTEISNSPERTVNHSEMGDSEFHTGEEKNEAEPAAAEPKTTNSELIVTSENKRYKFNLDPADAKLKQALELGLGARKWRSELDKTKSELEKLKSSNNPQLQERAKVWDEVKELREAGHYEQVAKAVLGDKFDAYRQQIIDEYNALENGSPDDVHALEKNRLARDKQYTEQQAKKEIDKLRAELDARDDRVREDTMLSRGEQMLRKYDMSQYVNSPDEAHELNTAVWELAWNTLLQTHGEQDKDPSSLEVERAFARAAKLLRGGRSKVVENRVQAVTEQKRAQARDAARTAATQNYSAPTQDNKMKDWDGRSTRDLFRALGL